MIDLSWTIEDDREPDLAEPPRPLLSTWNYLRSALRRRWRLATGLAALGALLGLGFVVLLPPGSTATVTLLLAHPASLDGPDRGAMDLSLLNTREVSVRTVQSLGLAMTPEAFRATITAEPVTPEVLTLKVAAPDDAAAVAREQELVRQYLAFRATQLRSLSSGLRSEYTARVTSAREQVSTLTRQFEQLSTQGAQGASQAFDVLARRSDLNQKIADWQETIDNATLQTEAALESTHVIDPVHADRSSAKRAMALAGASGLVAGGALGVGLVVFRALVTERLRRRKDVGIALGASVRFGVRSKGPRDRGAGWRRLLPAGAGWAGSDLAVLAQGLLLAIEAPDRSSGVGHTAAGPAAVVPTDERRHETRRESRRATMALTAARAGVRSSEADGKHREGAPRHNGVAARGPGAGPGRGPSRGVALAAIGNPRAAADVLSATAQLLRERGVDVFMVDLSRRQSLAATAEKHASVVRRPTGIPELARGPRGTEAGATIDLAGDWRADWDSADVVLALVEVDPGIEVRPIATWVDRVVPLVMAGAATAELLSTTADLVRDAGFELPFAMMVGCDVTDQSLGIVRQRDDAVQAPGSAVAGSAG